MWRFRGAFIGGFTRGLLQSVIAGLVPVIHLSAGLEGSGVEGVARLSEHLTVEDAEGWIPGTSPRMTLLGVEVLLGVGCFRECGGLGNVAVWGNVTLGRLMSSGLALFAEAVVDEGC